MNSLHFFTSVSFHSFFGKSASSLPHHYCPLLLFTLPSSTFQSLTLLLLLSNPHPQWLISWTHTARDPLLTKWLEWRGKHCLTITFRADLLSDSDCFRDSILLWEVDLVCLTPVWQRKTPHWSYNPLPRANPSSTGSGEERKILKTTKTLVNTLAV